MEWGYNITAARKKHGKLQHGSELASFDVLSYRHDVGCLPVLLMLRS